MFKKGNLHISMILGLTFIILMGLLMVSLQSKFVIENFEQPGEYPVSVDQPLLHDTYKVTKNPGLSIDGAEQNYVNYPVFSSSSCTNNNIRYWRRPTNGLCTPPDFCGNLYTNTEPTISKSAVPPEWDNGIRVNFYESEFVSCA